MYFSITTDEKPKVSPSFMFRFVRWEGTKSAQLSWRFPWYYDYVELPERIAHFSDNKGYKRPYYKRLHFLYSKIPKHTKRFRLFKEYD